MDSKKDFFISYTADDKQWAKWIAGVLEENGYTTAIQAWDFKPGDNFVLNMHKALQNTERFIAVLSKNYLSSLYCQAEWTAAFTKDPNSEKALFIPVRVSDIEPDGLLAAIIYIDLFGVDEKEAIKKLLNALSDTVNPRNKPGFPGTAKPKFPGQLPYNNLPFIKNIHFTGRNDIINKIKDKFQNIHDLSIAQAISGLGGIGKTQIALEYAYRFAHNYDLIWWINAENTQSVIKDFTDFALGQGLIAKEQAEESIIINIVINWMDSHEKWLFIYDNIENYKEIESYLPKNNRGNILMTSRNTHFHIGEKIDVEVFGENESMEFLEKRTNIIDKDTSSELAKRLGFLPLALEQAAAYIKENGKTYKDYLKLLDDYGLDVFDEDGYITDYTKPVTATWNISIDKVNMESAKQILYLFSYFAPEDIELALFVKCSEMLPEPLKNEIDNRLKQNKIVSELAKYSLIAIKDNKINIHRLLQEVIRKSIQGNTQWLHYCFEMVEKTSDYDNSRAKFLKDVPHTISVLDAAFKCLQQTDNQKRIAVVYAKIGKGFNELGSYLQALAYYNKALVIRKKMLGEEHPSTAATLSDTALVYNNNGDYSKALECCYKALAINEKLLGEEHPSTATTYNNIALVYDSLGDYHKALEWYHKALVIDEKVYGKENTSTATVYNNIGAVCDVMGDYPSALDWFQKALAIREKILGKEHSITSDTYNNIASMYDHQGDYPKALEYYHKALVIKEKVLGEEHPITITIYSNMALVYDKLGDYPKALELNQKALVIREKVLGKNHPNTATTYNNIALVYDNLRDYPKALEWYQKALDICEKVLGKEHPFTANIFNNIAAIYYSQGDYPKALEWYQKALAIREKVLGKGNPETATTYSNIAVVYCNKADYPEALEWQQKALVIREKILGKDHSDTATSYNNIAVVYYSIGDYPKALEWFQKALVIYEKVLGKNHPNTKNVLKNIGKIKLVR